MCCRLTHTTAQTVLKICHQLKQSWRRIGNAVCHLYSEQLHCCWILIALINSIICDLQHLDVSLSIYHSKSILLSVLWNLCHFISCLDNFIPHYPIFFQCMLQMMVFLWDLQRIWDNLQTAKFHYLLQTWSHKAHSNFNVEGCPYMSETGNDKILLELTIWTTAGRKWEFIASNFLLTWNGDCGLYLIVSKNVGHCVLHCGY